MRSWFIDVIVLLGLRTKSGGSVHCLTPTGWGKHIATWNVHIYIYDPFNYPKSPTASFIYDNYPDITNI